MARAKATLQPALLMLVMLPFWTSFLLRVYAWKGLLERGRLGRRRCSSALGIDHLLLAAGLIAAPGKLMNTPFSLVLGMVYTYLPFMILPLYGNLAKMDLRLLEAAADLGATPWVAFWTRHGAAVQGRHHRRLDAGLHPLRRRVRDPRAAGRPADADDRPRAVGRVLQQQRLADGLDRRRGDGAADHRAAGHLQPATRPKRRSSGDERASVAMPFGRAASNRVASAARLAGAAGYLFLYLPIVALVVYSFNDSPLPNVWSGFTLKWYAALADDREIVGGLWLSLQDRRSSPPAARWCSARWRRSRSSSTGASRGRTLFSGMVNAPLVMPEVIVGLSLLLMLVIGAARARLSRARRADDLARPPAARHGLRRRWSCRRGCRT